MCLRYSCAGSLLNNLTDSLHDNLTAAFDAYLPKLISNLLHVLCISRHRCKCGTILKTMDALGAEGVAYTVYARFYNL